MSLGARDAQIQDPLLFLQCLKKAKLSGIALCVCVRAYVCVSLCVTAGGSEDLD